ncbi:glutathione S-transferase N-terminal domain-containing protein [Yunchengibacter salinarum]|uniref:glutathione S-transferase N-terminal domain-containing protein n=1 Tax=Yunchengibacter salinarum TaxID=3133399 RepID=UPI0035B65104
MRQLYELCSEDEAIRFSPFVWRARLALRHKGLDFQTVPWRFREKDRIAGSGSKTVPVLNDDGRWVSDSAVIARYLDDHYPDHPLLGVDAARGMAAFIENWVDGTLVAQIFPMIAKDIVALLDEEDRTYFRETREPRLGKTLEEAAAEQPERLTAFHKSLAPMRRTLKQQTYLGGDRPAWADYVAASPFIWARIASPMALLDGEDIIADWLDRIMDLFDGDARKAPRGHGQAA